MMTQALNLENLRVIFPGGVEAVRGLSITLERGLIHAVVGESGCGKSVTCRAVMGLLPQAAEVSWSTLQITGKEITSGNAQDRGMASIRGRSAAMVFQEPGRHLNPALTVQSFLVEVIRRDLPDKKAARERAASLLEMVDLNPRKVLRCYPHELSGGMKQRVLIAAAVSRGPELLLADEPTTALDAGTQAQILALLTRLSGKLGMAVLLVTHDFGVVEAAADVVSVMYAGKIVERAPAKQLFSHPVHPYTRGLLRAVPRIANRGRRLEFIPGGVPDASSLPEGCAFHPRCTMARESCRSEVPPLKEVGTDHTAACPPSLAPGRARSSP